MEKIEKVSTNDEKGMFFTDVLLERLAQLDCAKIGLDWGCADGDRTAKILQQNPCRKIVAIDIAPMAVIQTRRRIARIGGKILPVISDSLSAISPQRKFDFIMVNPPQMPNPQDGSEANLIDHGGPKGTEVFEKIISEARNYLNVGGRLFLLVFDFLNLDEILEKNTFQSRVIRNQQFNIRPGGTTESMLPQLRRLFPHYDFDNGIGMSVIEAWLV